MTIAIGNFIGRITKAVGGHAASLLMETGSYLLLENGATILLE